FLFRAVVADNHGFIAPFGDIGELRAVGVEHERAFADGFVWNAFFAIDDHDPFVALAGLVGEVFAVGTEGERAFAEVVVFLALAAIENGHENVALSRRIGGAFGVRAESQADNAVVRLRRDSINDSDPFAG